MNHIINKIVKMIHINKKDIVTYEIVKKSIDARNKENILYIYTIDIEILNELEVIKKINDDNITLSKKETYISPKKGSLVDRLRPVIIGSGPSGLFVAYILAENGYKPLIIEQGQQISERVKSVQEFWNSGNLNESSNVQFGEGGAGTFSDGKLNTMVKDKLYRGKKVFEIFVECGAPKEILYKYNPHIGTDLLRNVVINMRKKIESFGGEFLFNSKMTDIDVENGKLKGIIIDNRKAIECNNLFLCIGHSARDTFYMLSKKGVLMKNKPFAIGLRIQHFQKDIDKSMFGEKNIGKLEPASYKLTYHTKKGRGVYSFCMCPGGYVIDASSIKEHLVINGMSNYKRDSKYANSAIVVTVNEKDYGSNLFDGVKFQIALENLAYNYGNGMIPMQTYKGLKERKVYQIGKVKPMIKGKYKLVDLNKFLPEFVLESIKEAMMNFGKKIKNFDDDDALLYAIESRTSSPITILRNEEGMSNINGIYPCGEGAGYAGGITTSAIDGIKQAENYIKKYKNN